MYAGTENTNKVECRHISSVPGSGTNINALCCLILFFSFLRLTLPSFGWFGSIGSPGTTFTQAYGPNHHTKSSAQKFHIQVPVFIVLFPSKFSKFSSGIISTIISIHHNLHNLQHIRNFLFDWLQTKREMKVNLGVLNRLFCVEACRWDAV